MAMERQRESEIKECVARIREKSGETNSISDQVFRIRHTSCSGSHASRASSNQSLSSRSNSQGRENSVSEVFSSSQPVSLSNVYFISLTRWAGLKASPWIPRIPRTHTEKSKENETSEISNGVSIFHPSGAHSHPHSLPNVHRPRLLLCGAAGQGQSSHLGPALLHTLEEFPVKILDLSVIFGVSSRSPEETLTQVMAEHLLKCACTLYACFFLPSASLTSMYNVYMYTCTCVSIAAVPRSQEGSPFNLLPPSHRHLVGRYHGNLPIDTHLFPDLPPSVHLSHRRGNRRVHLAGAQPLSQTALQLSE